MILQRFLITTLCLSTIATYANDLSASLSQFPIQDIESEQQESINRLIKRHGGSFIRPAACPLASKNYSDILSKIESIRGLFKDPSCLGDETALSQTFNNLVETSDGIQEQLATVGVETEGDVTQVNGASINSLFSNLNTLFFQNSCELIDQNVLEKGADFAQNFAQMGLLIPNNNGIYISGGGLALSSILRLINNLFTKKFNFENNSERQSFIKLNCAFYDIRRDIEKSGLVEIALPEHRIDLSLLQDIQKNIEDLIKANQEAKSKQIESISTAESEFVALQSQNITSLEKAVTTALSLVSKKVADREEGKRPAETVKKEMLAQLVDLREPLTLGLENYFNLNQNALTVFDLDLKNELSKLDLALGQDKFMVLFKMPAEEFNQTYRASLLFHFERILSDLKDYKGKIKSDWRKVTKIKGQSIDDYLKSLNKKLEEQNKELNAKRKSLRPITERLERIVGSDSGFTRSDDGTENKTAILSSYDEIANQVYGKWGYEFLKYTTKTAEKENDNFSKKFSDFADSHLDVVDNKYVIKDSSDMDELRVLYACQDAKPYIRRYSEADSLVQQAYDFVVTNKELFHSDHNEPFLSEVTRIRSVFEKIQDHHKSSIYALKTMRGEDISSRAKERYLGDKARRREYLGTVMLKVNDTKPKAQLLQSLLDRYDCNRLTNLDD